MVEWFLLIILTRCVASFATSMASISWFKAVCCKAVSQNVCLSFHALFRSTLRGLGEAYSRLCIGSSFLRSALEQSWDAERFNKTRAKHESRRAEDTIDTDKATRAIESVMFWLYCEMLMTIHSVVEGLVCWSEGCFSHAIKFDRADKHRRWRRRKHWQALVG